MEDDNKDITQDKLVDNLIQTICGFSDEQLLKEFEEAEQDTEFDPNMQVYPDEFDRIWEDICAERNEPSVAEVAEKPVQKKKMSWKKIAVFALAASLTTASVCFVAIGKKSYFYRENGGNSNGNIVFDNDSSILVHNKQEDAYDQIEKELEIKPFRLGYMPEGMIFDHLEINNRNAIMQFTYNGEMIYLVQASDKTEVSNNHITDGQAFKNVKNVRLAKEIVVNKEDGEDEKEIFNTQFTFKNSYCWLSGVMNEDEFTKVVERIIY